MIFPWPKSTDFDILHFRRLLPPAITVLASHRVKLFPTLDGTLTSPKMKIKMIRGAVQASKENLNIIFYKIFLKKKLALCKMSDMAAEKIALLYK